MFQLMVEDVFRIKNRGVVATGRVESGAVSVGDTVTVNGRSLVVAELEMFRKRTDTASVGDTVGLLFDDEAHDVLARGAVITGDGVAPPAAGADDVADLQRDVGLGDTRRKRRFFGRG